MELNRPLDASPTCSKPVLPTNHRNNSGLLGDTPISARGFPNLQTCKSDDLLLRPGKPRSGPPMVVDGGACIRTHCMNLYVGLQTVYLLPTNNGSPSFVA